MLGIQYLVQQQTKAKTESKVWTIVSSFEVYLLKHFFFKLSGRDIFSSLPKTIMKK